MSAPKKRIFAISIHALREESDRISAVHSLVSQDDFNPRPPRGERPCCSHLLICSSFISIHALREESDWVQFHSHPRSANFNPRPPRGERQIPRFYEKMMEKISIHALREESDFTTVAALIAWWKFQSTPSARRATERRGSSPGVFLYFNPRPPRGERRWCMHGARRPRRFQSTPSARRATDKGPRMIYSFDISIHALREESDSKSGEKIHHVCSIIHTCAQFEKELYEGSGEMQNKSC